MCEPYSSVVTCIGDHTLNIGYMTRCLCVSPMVQEDQQELCKDADHYGVQHLHFYNDDSEAFPVDQFGQKQDQRQVDKIEESQGDHRDGQQR